MKNIRITFRLSPYQLARGLQTIRQLEPTYKLISLNDIVKVIYHDYLSKMTLNKLNEIPSEILNEVVSFIKKPAKTQITLEELIAIKKAKSIPELKPIPKPKPVSEPKPDLSDEILSEINKVAKASSFDDPNKTDSSISSLTDFSPPKDWTE